MWNKKRNFQFIEYIFFQRANEKNSKSAKPCDKFSPGVHLKFL